MTNDRQTSDSELSGSAEDLQTSKPTLSGTYIKVEASTNDGLRDGAINLFKSIHGRDPTADEIARMEARLAERMERPTR